MQLTECWENKLISITYIYIEKINMKQQETKKCKQILLLFNYLIINSCVCVFCEFLKEISSLGRKIDTIALLVHNSFIFDQRTVYRLKYFIVLK